MGYIRHHSIIVTSWNRLEINKAHNQATLIFDEVVSDIVESKINGYVSFFIAPDGSKEGWKDSERGDKNRAEFIDWINAQSYDDGSNSLDYIEVFYGDDNKEAKIVNHN